MAEAKSRKTTIPIDVKLLQSFLKRGTMYHSTKRENLQKILKHGLIPSKPEVDSTIVIEGVYLSMLPFDWMHYATDETTAPGCHIEINVIGLELLYDNGILELEDYQHHPAFVYPGIIKPDRFVNVSVSTEKNPSQFRVIKLRS